MTTKIEWATEVWNPVTGCNPISEGCANCYAKRMAQRLKGRFGYPEDEPFRVTLHADKLNQPLRWKKPRRIFVVSMGDLFHVCVRITDLTYILDIMSKCKWHTFMILTKRIDRASKIMDNPTWWEENKHVWLGVSAENQARADERIPILLQIPAAKYFVSHEPGLGLIAYPPEFLALGNKAWLITGGESGPGARPMHPDIPRHDRDQCVGAGVPFFFKQWGEWGDLMKVKPVKYSTKIEYHRFSDDVITFKYGKKYTGRLLDGREWNDMP